MFRSLVAVLFLLPLVTAIGEPPAPVPPATEIDTRIFEDEDRATDTWAGAPGYAVGRGVDLQALDVREHLDEAHRPGLGVRVLWLPPEDPAYPLTINITFRIGSALHAWTFSSDDGGRFTGPLPSRVEATDGATRILSVFAPVETLDAGMATLSWGWAIEAASGAGPGDVMPGSYRLPGGSMAPQLGDDAMQGQYRLQGPGRFFSLHAGGLVDWWRDRGVVSIELENLLRMPQDVVLTVPEMGWRTEVPLGAAPQPLTLVLGPAPADPPAALAIHAWSSLGAAADADLPVLTTTEEGVLPRATELPAFSAHAYRIAPGHLALRMADAASLRFDVAVGDGTDDPVTVWWIEREGRLSAYADRLSLDSDDTLRLANLADAPVAVAQVDPAPVPAPAVWPIPVALGAVLAAVAAWVRR